MSIHTKTKSTVREIGFTTVQPTTRPLGGVLYAGMSKVKCCYICDELCDIENRHNVCSVCMSKCEEAGHYYDGRDCMVEYIFGTVCERCGKTWPEIR